MRPTTWSIARGGCSTAELSQFALADARKAAIGTVRKALDRLQRCWNALNRAQTEGYKAYDEVPDELLGALQRAVGAVADDLADKPMLPGDPVLGLYWEMLRFLTLAEQMGGHALFDLSLATGYMGRQRTPASTLCIRNVVPAPHLQARHAAAHASVLFSGTLSPPQFYRDMLGLPADTRWVEVDSPFQAGQLELRVAGHISTRYRDREQSLQLIAELMAGQFARQPGNYLCFCSSFDYLQRVADTLQRLDPQLPVWRQTPSMDEDGRNAFLERFSEQGQGIGFAVLGGVFSEGVDLPGRRLIGAFVATLGLPQINPVNERMRQVMAAYFGADKGYDYTYLYPGLRKVVQAAGRVIRSEQDCGVVFLIDDRYRRSEVRALLPRWWRVQGRGESGSPGRQ
ncbi:ATP-dependent DNA helicase [Thauera sp. SDU_THAU2]|uniref:ATP-dependent DNA helicase n=1 Tax=Thauera sp. SDU_THAU2 TaxID=3136633 RepID=UPI00311E9501